MLTIVAPEPGRYFALHVVEIYYMFLERISDDHKERREVVGQGGIQLKRGKGGKRLQIAVRSIIRFPITSILLQISTVYRF